MDNFIKKLPFFLRVGIVATLFLVPLFYNPLTYNEYELQKLIILRASLEALFAIYILWTISQKRPIVKWGTMTKAVLGFVVTMYLASIMGVDFGQSFLGNYWRGQGLFTLLHYLMLYILVSNSGDFGLSLKDIFLPLVASGVLVSLGAVFQFVLIWTGGETPPLQYLFNGRYHVVFGNPNFFGAFLALLVPVVSWYFITTKKKYWLIAGAIMLFGIVLSGSKGALIGAVFGCIAVLGKRTINIIKVIMIIILCVVFLYSNNRESVYESRTAIWESGIRAFAQKPILGWGMENFDDAYKLGVKDNWLSEIYVDKAHNEIIEVMVAGGIVGLAFYLLLLVNFFKRAQLLLKGVMVSFILISFTNVISVTSYLFFWILLGLAGKEDNVVNFKTSKILGALTVVLLVILILFNCRYMLADVDFKNGSGKAYQIFPFERLYIDWENK